MLDIMFHPLFVAFENNLIIFKFFIAFSPPKNIFHGAHPPYNVFILSECHKSHYFELPLHPVPSPNDTQTRHMQLARDGWDRHAGCRLESESGLWGESRLGLPCPWKMENIVMSADSFYCLDRHTDIHAHTRLIYLIYHMQSRNGPAGAPCLPMCRVQGLLN